MDLMSEIIAGVEVPETAAVAEALGMNQIDVTVHGRLPLLDWH